MKNKALEEIENRIMSLRPKRITLKVDLDGRAVEIPVCEVHRMIHKEKLTIDSIQGEWNCVLSNMGNSSADLEAWFHLLKCHMNGIHGELSSDKEWRDISEEEAHEKLLNDMASGQIVKLWEMDHD